MAAGQGYIEFATGDVLTAAAANGYLASQVVMVFASSAARTSAIASPQEGMISYLKDTNSTEYYSGSAWVAIGGGGLSSPLTTKGDVWGYSTTNARIPVGTNGQILTADSAEALGVKWATPSSGSGMTLVTSGTFSASSEFNLGTCFNSTYRNYKIILDTTATSTNLQLRAKLNDDSNHSGRIVTVTNATTVTEANTDRWAVAQFDGSIGSIDMTIFAPQVAEYTKMVCLGTASSVNSWSGGVKTANTGFTTITFFTSTGNITGNYRVYGLANS